MIINALSCDQNVSNSVVSQAVGLASLDLFVIYYVSISFAIYVAGI